MFEPHTFQHDRSEPTFVKNLNLLNLNFLNLARFNIAVDSLLVCSDTRSESTFDIKNTLTKILSPSNEGGMDAYYLWHI